MSSLVVPLGTVRAATTDVPYDANGYWAGPVLCPLRIPDTGWFFTTRYPFMVPKFLGYAGDEVPFSPSSFQYTKNIQPVMIGQGWFVPDQTRTFYQNLHWEWEGKMGTPPGVLFFCGEERLFWGMIVLRSLSSGAIWGSAVVDADDFGAGTGMRSTGGGGEGQQCWDVYEWWIDETGYHEEFSYSFCEEVYAT